MSKVRKSHITALGPYMVGEKPRSNGEWDMHCPLHEDGKRSASLNIEKGYWFCNAGCGGGRVSELIAQRADWVDPSTAATNGHAKPKSGSDAPTESITEAKVKGWASALQSNADALEELQTERGLTNDTIETYEIGWDRSAKAYTIPVRSPDSTIWNIRRYQLHPPEGRRKIWGVTGMNSPRLYPMTVLDDNPSAIIICEGELDALAGIQAGFPTITRTGAAKVWHNAWNNVFADRVVYLCHDMDKAGQEGNSKVARALERIAREVRVLRLPYPVTEKHGKDLTDFLLEYDADALKDLVRDAPLIGSERANPLELDPSDATVLDSFDSRRVGKPLRLTVTVKGKREPGYSVPRKAHLRCTQDAGKKCEICPMNTAGGDDTTEIPGHDALVLELIDASKQQVHDVVRRKYGAQKCNRLDVEIEEHQAVEVLYARPSVDHSNGQANAGDYKNIKLTSVGRHDTMPNNTVQVVGALHPEPRSQLNEFVAWEVARMESSLDSFEMDGKTYKALRRFQPRDGQRPLKKLAEIARAMAAHVTHIYGRPEMHALMDLVFHSVLAFDFAGQRQNRGWIDALVVGDTRTGKSEAATRLTHHYRAGEVVSCESASFAGIIGGLQQYGSGKEWAVNWGVVPLNDRRLVVLDEVGGLTTDEIAQMSDVRSRGVAQLTKIQQETTFARTRLLWLGNPRNARMADYTYGVQAIRPLIGNAEDIARFDVAMSVSAGEVGMDEINRPAAEGENRYGVSVASRMVRWAWSRQPDQIVWARGAEKEVFAAAQQLGESYVEDPPLVQAANARIKVARLSVALAARLFSTDDSGEVLIVTRDHVRDAVIFLNKLYGMPGFGYTERSRELIGDRQAARNNRKAVRAYLRNRPTLAKLLRGTGKFRRQDLEEILNVTREEANGIINTLWEARMVRKEGGDVRVEPMLHELLREVQS